MEEWRKGPVVARMRGRSNRKDSLGAVEAGPFTVVGGSGL